MIDLAVWHATPVRADQAQHELARLRLATTHSERLHALRLRLILDLPSDMQRDVLLAEANTPAERAAVELLTGQVLLAKRLHGAWVWLDAAEPRLSDLLPATAYLALLRRHRALRPLTLFAQPKPMRPLDELLRIAAMTAQIEGRPRQPSTHNARDTLG